MKGRKSMRCNKDCLNCKKEYCTDVYRDSSRYCNRSEHSRQANKDYQKKKRDEARKKDFASYARRNLKSMAPSVMNVIFAKKDMTSGKLQGRGNCGRISASATSAEKIQYRDIQLVLNITKSAELPLRFVMQVLIPKKQGGE